MNKRTLIQGILSSFFSIALCVALLPLGALQSEAQAETTVTTSNETRIHVMTFSLSDCIILESQGKFGIVDSGEDDDYPDGSDPRYPAREGITQEGGHEREVIEYLLSLGVTKDNLEFYIGTHPHSDHIGSADEVIRVFHPKRVYITEYKDEYISEEGALWDNLYVYDNMIAAAKEVGATLIQNLNPKAPVDPVRDKPSTGSSGNTGGSGDSGDSGSTSSSGDSGNTSDTGNSGDTGDSSSVIEPNTEPSSVEYLTARQVEERFGVNPTDPSEQYNPTSLSNGVIAVSASDDPNEIEEPQEVSTTGNPKFMLGEMEIEIMNYGDGYKTKPVPDANYFSWGVKVTVNKSTAFLAGDINNYDGDEDRLAKELGKIDFLKLGHHGGSSSNTSFYLQQLSPRYATWTHWMSVLPDETWWTLDSLGTRLFPAVEEADAGYQAIIATFSSNGLSFNTMDDEPLYGKRATTPHMVRYVNGLRAGVEEDELVHVGEDWYVFLAPRAEWNHSDIAIENVWVNMKDGIRYARPDGRIAIGWALIDDKWYFFEDDGLKGTGWLEYKGNWYYLGKDGVMITGWYKEGTGKNAKWYYLDPLAQGAMAKGFFTATDGKRYFANSSGVMQTGWLKKDNKWYYLQPSGAMKTGWYLEGTIWYYLDPLKDGIMRTGWFDDVFGGRYYAKGSGAMATGWQKIKGAWYYLRSSGSLLSGWLNDKGTWYYLDLETGKMRTGWYQDNTDTWYHSNGSGAMSADRWIKSGKKWYYVGPSGDMYTSTWVGNYWLDEDGVMATSAWVDHGKYYVDASGAWVPGKKK